MTTDRPTRAEISLRNLDHNLNVVRDIVGNRKIMAVVKANAYGHGLIDISKRLVDNGVNYLAVAFVEEALELRESGINTPILVLGAINNQQIPLFINNNIELTGSSIEKLQAISQYAVNLNKQAKVHLKVDTGMGRIGVQWDRVKDFLNIAFTLPNLNIVGIFSHFADAEDDIQFTHSQIQRFNKVLDILFSKYSKRDKVLVHNANSGAIAQNLSECFGDMVRPGLILYGYSTIKSVKGKLKPVMSLKTQVSYFKVLNAGVSVGYERTYTTSEQTRVVTLPIGYADGYPRSLSNRSSVYIRGSKYPLIGNVCMDQCMVNIGSNGEAYNGDTVLLWGEDIQNGKNVNIDLLELSKLAERSIYEILCSVSARVPRVLV